jgi:hypothetical protein
MCCIIATNRFWAGGLLSARSFGRFYCRYIWRTFSMKHQTILKRAKANISDPAKWHKGHYFDTAGTCMCSLGAIIRVIDPYANCYDIMSDGNKQLFDNVVRNLEPLDSDRVADFNDDPETSHEDIMTMFDDAISSAEFTDE